MRLVVVIGCALALVGCGSDAGGDDIDGGAMQPGASDAGIDGGAPPDTMDGAIDGGPEAICASCGDDERCVVHCGGTGEIVWTECVETSCGTECTPECEAELCDDNFPCEYDCRDTPEGAFSCAGP